MFLLHTQSMCKLPWNYSFVSITLLEIMPPEQWQDFHGEILTGLHSIMLELDYIFIK